MQLAQQIGIERNETILENPGCDECPSRHMNNLHWVYWIRNNLSFKDDSGRKKTSTHPLKPARPSLSIPQHLNHQYRQTSKISQSTRKNIIMIIIITILIIIIIISSSSSSSS